MNIGRMDRKVTLLKTTNSNNEAGDWKDRYGTFAVCWAERYTTAGVETEQSGQTVGVRNTVYELRYMEGVTEYMLLRDEIDGVYWNITSVEEIGRNEKIRLQCFKRDNQ